MPLFLLCCKKTCSAQLLTCKRVRDVSFLLPPFCESTFGTYIQTVHRVYVGMGFALFRFSLQENCKFCYSVSFAKEHVPLSYTGISIMPVILSDGALQGVC